MKTRMIYAIVLGALLPGCSGGVTPIKEARIEASKGFFGGSFKISSDFNGEIVGLHYNPATKGFDAERITVVSNASAVNPTLVPIAAEARAYQDSYFTGMVNYTDAINRSPIIQGLGAAIPMIPPIVGSYVQNRGAVRLAETQNRGALIQAVAGMAANFHAGVSPVNPAKIPTTAIPADIMAEAVKTFPAAFAPPTTQP